MATTSAPAPTAAPPAVPEPGPARTARPAAGARPWQERFARTAGTVVSLAAIWSLLSIVARGSFRDLGDTLFGIVNLPVGPTLFNLALLFLLAGTLHRRMRLGAWVLFLFQVLALLDAAAVVLLALSNEGGSLLRQFSAWDWVELGVVTVSALVLAPVVWAARPAFPARLYRPSRRAAPLVLLVGLAVSAAVSLLLTWLFPRSLEGAGERVLWALRVVVGVDTGRLDAAGTLHQGHQWVAAVVGLLSGLALVVAAVVFLRAARAKPFLDAEDELDVRRLLADWGGRDSLGYFATRRDKSVVFGPGRRAAVTHRVLASVSLASGDPVGSPDAWAPAIRDWLAEARTYGWYPAVLGVSEAGARAYVAAGLKAIPIGDEAVVDVRSFSLRSSALQPVQRAVDRVARAGYTLTVVRHADLGDDGFAEIARCAEAWRGDEPERGFSMALNRLGDPADGHCVAVLARDPAGRLQGVLSFVPWGTNGLSLELMRHDPDAENGLTEAMVAAAIGACPDLGVARVSLNFAVLRGIFEAAERVGAGPLVRTGNAALVFASRFWQLQSLYRTTARYRPRWEPRYICYDTVFTLPRVAVASMAAEGFLPLWGADVPDTGERTVTQEGRTVPLAEAVAELERQAAARGVDGPRLTQQERDRRAAMEFLRATGMEPYPASVPRTCDVRTLRAAHAGLPAGTRTGRTESVTGRVRAVRDFGGLVFAVLQEEGALLQVMLTRDAVGTDSIRTWRRGVDLGDVVSVTGEVVASDTGELSVVAHSWAMAAKCLEPVPGLRGSFSDPEARVRERHLDLIVNEPSRATVLARSRAVRALRDLLTGRGFSEVETPVLQAVHGGAQARPFTTTINAYGMGLYLRIAPELFLKRLCVGGLQNVFELGRNFRNEGADATHNPEFTSLEVYQAYADYTVMRTLTQELIVAAAVAMHGAPVAMRPDTGPVDLSGPWPVVPVHEAVSRATGVQLDPGTPKEDVLAVCRRLGVHVPARASAGEAVLELYDALVEPATTTPTFYTDFPLETSPLTRVHREDPRLSERWDLVAFGMELGTAYTELTDPVDQRHRFTEQSLRAAAGDPEAMQLDEDFLRAIAHGMPPTGGLGLGVDRLVMLLTGGTVRSTLAFPFVRPDRRR
ncbi:bifunctional lysylphosphatidylglycerol synthetase/lysine--tRNA ligase LysX [Blastococcus sp. SYSU D00695]